MSYRHILVPTDGSSRSRAAAVAAVALARALGARITGLFVVAEGVPTAFSGERLYASGVVGRRTRALAKLQGSAALAEIDRRAAAAHVRHQGIQRRARAPWRAILRAARARGCDLIVMGSHGRGRVKTALLGSQALQVLARSRIPVLVCR